MKAKQAGNSKLLDELREAIRLRHYSIRTEHRVKVEAAWRDAPVRDVNSRGILWTF